MNESIAKRLTLFVENSQSSTRDFAWTAWPQIRHLMSLMYALEDRSIDSAAIKESSELMKANTGMFSIFRSGIGISSLCVAAKLSLQDSQERLFEDILTAYDRLRDAKFRASDQLALSAFLVATNTERHNFKKVADRAQVFHEGLRGRLWFLAQDDAVFSSMLGLSDMIPSVGIERIEELHEQLKPEFRWRSRSTVQNLAQVLALGGKTDDALNCLFDLNKALRAEKMRLDKEYTLPALGTLSLLPVDNETLIRDLTEAQEYLKGQKGFRSLSIQERLLFAAAVISSVYAEECTQASSASAANSTTVGIVNIVIAQQIAIMISIMNASIAASTVAASA
ncbi:MAG: DUF4003 domain-containing protein [Coriobacteriia bacterium]|nr:DUF4003 domain-containing protein [Coriobacteriia bacterium]